MNQRPSNEDFHYAHQALTGRHAYHSEHASITRFELYLMHWLNGFEVEQSDECQHLLYTLFRPLFPYEGPLYRGFSVPESTPLTYQALAAFTSDEEIAEEFADTHADKIVSYLFRLDGPAFDFEAFLQAIDERTTNEDLSIVIEDRIWEKEKWAPFDPAVARKLPNR